VILEGIREVGNAGGFRLPRYTFIKKEKLSTFLEYVMTLKFYWT